MNWVTAVMLVSVRLGALLVAAPIFGPVRIPGTIRVLMTVGLAVAL